MKHPVLTGAFGGWLASHAAGAKGQRFQYVAGGMLVGLVAKQFQGIDQDPPDLRQQSPQSQQSQQSQQTQPPSQIAATRFINSSGVSPFAGCSEASWPY